MNQNREASLCRLRMRELLDKLGQLASVAQGRSPWLRASLYPRRRRCGSRICRRVRGKLHQNMVLAVRIEGQSRLIALGGVKLERAEELIGTYRHLSHTRAQLVRACGRLLKTFDALGRLRQVEWAAAGRGASFPT